MTLERDVLDVSDRAHQLDELPRLLRVAAARIGGIVDLTSMGGAIEMKRDSVRRYLRLLELLFLVRTAPAWGRNLAQQVIRKPKLWIPDSGLACQLTGCGEDRFVADETGMAGSLFENFVASEIVKQASRLERRVELHHFRTAGGREVDIVGETEDGSVVGIEVKLGATPRMSDFSGLAPARGARRPLQGRRGREHGSRDAAVRKAALGGARGGALVVTDQSIGFPTSGA
jgi:uncharacterized protein